MNAALTGHNFHDVQIMNSRQWQIHHCFQGILCTFQEQPSKCLKCLYDNVHARNFLHAYAILGVIYP